MSSRRLRGGAPNGASGGEDDRPQGEAAPSGTAESPQPDAAQRRQPIEPPVKQELGTAQPASPAQPEPRAAGKFFGSWLRLLWRTAMYRLREQLLVVLGLAIAAAVVSGSLVIGDSVRASLHETALARIGRIDCAVLGQGRFLDAGLAPRLQSALIASGELTAKGEMELAAGKGRAGEQRNAAFQGEQGLATPRHSGEQGLVAGIASGSVTVAPLLQLGGLASRLQRRANALAICGVDERFWALAPVPARHPGLVNDGVVLNRILADQLGAAVGDAVILRAEKPGLLPRDAPLTSTSDTTVALRLTVAAVIDDAGFGRFSLSASQLATPTAFVDLGVLQRRTALGAVANALLVAAADEARCAAALTAVWTPGDALLAIHPLPAGCEVRSDRVFLDSGVGAALLSGDALTKPAGSASSAGILGYFVNELRSGAKATPYSLVAAGEWERLPGGGSPIPALADDAIAINTWLAADLSAQVGERLTLRCFVIGPGGGLREDAADFTVQAIVPMTGVAADRSLMPHFPGISDSETCSDWHPGVPLDLSKIRKNDEDYWAKHRGTPKAFLSLAAGRRLWANRHGDLTAVRSAATPAVVADQLRSVLRPADLGLGVVPVRADALAASAKALDFSGLFLGLGLFVVISALVLAGLLVGLAAAGRRREIGVLLAIGFRPIVVFRLLLLECIMVSVAGCALGAGLGIAYAAIVLTALSGGWQAAVGSTAVALRVDPLTVLVGAASTALIAVVVLGWQVRRLHRSSPRALLAGDSASSTDAKSSGPERRRIQAWQIAAVCAVIAVGLLTVAVNRTGEAAIVLCFISGFVTLLGGIGAAWEWFRPSAGATSSITALALANAGRARGRSLAVVVVLACACFLVVAVGANRSDPLADRSPASGTGGFALVLETTVPLSEDLNVAADRERLALEKMDGVRFVPIRVGGGDDASCLNLNRSRTPQLFGVQPQSLAGRFTIVGASGPIDWDRLDATPLPPGAGTPLLTGDEAPLPAFADGNTALWSLGLALGDQVELTDERGRHFRVVLLGCVAPSLLQGGLFLSDRQLTRRFPSLGGQRRWLVDAPGERTAAVASELTRALADYGATVEPAGDRLAAYLAVERTYLDIFLTLGGWALLLGSLGVAVVVARNVLERRAEIAALSAIGFTRGAVVWLLLVEHATLLVIGLGLGAGAGLIAVWPALHGAAAVPWATLATGLAVILACGLLGTGLTAWSAVRGSRPRDLAAD